MPATGSPYSANPPADEAGRLAALRHTGLLDTPPEDAFDRITRLAARWMDTPMALITLVDEERQWFKSRLGIDRCETDRRMAFCAHNLHSEDVMVVEDATADPRFADNPLVTGDPGVRFYAGAPLITPNGHTLGSLCVMDTAPRSLSGNERETLTDLAAMTMDEIKLRQAEAEKQRAQRERRSAEEALDDQEELLHQLANNIPGILYQFVARPDGTREFRYVSDQAEALLGRDPDDVEDLFEYALSRVPASHREAVRASNEAAIAAQESWSAEFPFKAGSGEVVWLRGLSRPEQRNGEIVYYGVFLDVTERKRAEEQNRLQAQALQATANAIAITNADGIIQWVNPAFTDLTGYTEDEAIGASMSLLRSGKQDTSYYEDLWSTVKSGRVWQGELINRRRDGTLYIEEQTITPVTDEDGTPHHFIAVKRDVTARKKHEQALVEARDTAEAAQVEAEEARAIAEEMNRLKSAFLANMSHEIRTPLTSIIGFSEVLVDMDLEEPADQFAGLIQRSGDRLLNTLNSVLDLSQLEADAMTLHLERVDAGARVRNVAEGFALRAKDAGVDLTVRTPDGPTPALLDPGALERIASNLISNAIKFTGEDETGARSSDASVRVALTADTDALCLEVADTGVGIEPDFMPHLFDAFKQESTGDARKFEGSGLGLAITYELVHLLGGTIEVDSAKGEGTTFTVRLPRDCSSP